LSHNLIPYLATTFFLYIMQFLVLAVALFSTAEASRASILAPSLWTFKAQRPSSGFLGDVPEKGFLKPSVDIAKMDQKEFVAAYKQPRAEKKVANNFEKEINTTTNVSKIAIIEQKDVETTTNVSKTTIVETTTNVSKTAIIEQKDVETTTNSARKGSGLKILTQQEKPTEKETPTAKTTKKATVDAAAKPKRRKGSREVTLIESLQHMGGDEAVGCVTHCRYDEFMRHTWKECLDRCVENRLMRSAMTDMLPEDDHAAPELHHDVPHQLKDHLHKHKQRMEEL